MHGDIGRLTGSGAVQIARQCAPGRVENDGQMDPLIRRRIGSRGFKDQPRTRGDGSSKGIGNGGGEMKGSALPEVEEPLSGAIGIQENPGRDADRVFAVQGVTRELDVTAVARQVQNPAEPRVLDKGRPGTVQRRMEVVPG